MPLTEAQTRAIFALDWLLDPDDRSRRSGRSFAVAVAMIRRAARGADPVGRRRWMYVDHLPELDRAIQRQVIEGYVQALVASDPRLSPHATYWPDGFILRLPEPIIDWWPPDRAFERTEPPGPPPEYALSGRWEEFSMVPATTIEGALDEIVRDLGGQSYGPGTANHVNPNNPPPLRQAVLGAMPGLPETAPTAPPPTPGLVRALARSRRDPETRGGRTIPYAESHTLRLMKNKPPREPGPTAWERLDGEDF